MTVRKTSEELAASIRRSREIFTKLADMEEPPMTTPRCENFITKKVPTVDEHGRTIKFFYDPEGIPMPDNSTGQRIEMPDSIIQKFTAALWETEPYMPKRLYCYFCELTNCMRPMPQHSEDQWFALYGRYCCLKASQRHGAFRHSDFLHGNRSEELWNHMQQAVANG